MAPTADDAAGEQASGVILEEHYVVVVLGAFSMLGSAFIILSWLCRKPLRTASTLLIFCLAVSDFMCASPGLFALWLLGVVVSVAVWLCGCGYGAMGLWLAYHSLLTRCLLARCLGHCTSDVGKFLATAALNLADDPAASTTGTTLCTVSGLIGQFFGEAAATWNAMLGTGTALACIDDR